MESGYNLDHLIRVAKVRWLKPAEVFFILMNYEEHQLCHEIPQKPASGSLFLFNKQVLKYFRKDGHIWRKRKDQRTVAEAHERLKVKSVETLNCYYARGKENPGFQRRCYWMLDPAYEHIVLVHYFDIKEGVHHAIPTSQFLGFSSVSSSPNSSTARQPDSSVVNFDSDAFSINQSSLETLENYSIEVFKNDGMAQHDNREKINEVHSSSVADEKEVLQEIEKHLGLSDDKAEEIGAFCIPDGISNDLEDVLCDSDVLGGASNDPNTSFLQQDFGEGTQPSSLLGFENEWRNILDSSRDLSYSDLQAQYPLFSPVVNGRDISATCPSSIFDQNQFGLSFEESTSLTVAAKQKFTIQDISPEWCYAYEGAKIIIVGSFLCDPSKSSWACMFGEIEVPIEIIQEGVLRCYAPPHLEGKVTLCVTSGNRESCSEIKEFEYRAKSGSAHSDPPETEASKSSEELYLLVRLVQMLLPNLPSRVDVSEPLADYLFKSTRGEETWSKKVKGLVSDASASNTLDWLLQELLKDKLDAWLSSRSRKDDNSGCSLPKKEQCILHIVAALGFEWALHPILNSGVGVNFRDINGWTALHWSARFAREKMVVALIASGALAGLVTDPSSLDPTGKTPAAVAAAYGHRGLAGYLSEVALTGHLSCLTLKESELSIGSAALETERALNSLSEAMPSEDEDQNSLKDILTAIRRAIQAAARIQAAFRAHSFRKRRQREALTSIAASGGDDYSTLENDPQALSAVSKLVFGNAHDNSAALSIQKTFKGWKDRKIFTLLRQKVVKIQAYTRGYQARKYARFAGLNGLSLWLQAYTRGYQARKYAKICWAVSMLEKAILRWQRRGVGLRGFRLESESMDDSEEDEDILKVFRKVKVDEAIDEAIARVLSTVKDPEARKQYRRLLEKHRQAKEDTKL